MAKVVTAECNLVDDEKKICQRIRTFSICEKSFWEIWEKLLISATKTELDAQQGDSHRLVYMKHNQWQISKSKAFTFWESDKCWTNSYSIREKRGNI